MDLRAALMELESGLEELFQATEELFSPGMDKYNSYQVFSESFAVDAAADVPEIEAEEADSEQEVNEFFRNYGEAEERKNKKLVNPKNYSPKILYPGIDIKKVPAGQLGYGILGRCFPYSGLIEIRSDLYGEDFREVLMHELTHMQHPNWSEMDVRVATRMRLPFSPRWH